MNSTPRALRDLADRVKTLEEKVRRQGRASQAGQRSVEDGGQIVVRDEIGTVRTVIGAATDAKGVFTVQDFNGDAPAVPSAPVVVQGAEAVTIVWDGFDDADLASWQPDFARVEVHVSDVAAYDPTDETQVGSFDSTKGGSLTLGAPYGGPTLFVSFVAANSSGVESGQSAVVAADGGPVERLTTNDPTSGTARAIVIRDDGDGGIIESYTGVAGETPGRYDPSARIVGRPSVAIRPGTTPTAPEASTMEMVAGVVGSPGTAGSLWRVFADRAELVSGGGAASVLALGSDVSIRGGTVSVRSSEPWTVVTSPAGGFVPVSGQPLRWRLDAAGNITMDGAVTLGVSDASGDRVFTFPVGARRDSIWRAPVRCSPFGASTDAQVEVSPGGAVRVYFYGPVTAIGLDTTFSIL